MLNFWEREGRPRSPIASVIQCRPNIKNMPSYRRRGRRPPLRKPIKRILSAEQCARRREGGGTPRPPSPSLAWLLFLRQPTPLRRRGSSLPPFLPPCLPPSISSSSLVVMAARSDEAEVSSSRRTNETVTRHRFIFMHDQSQSQSQRRK